MRKIALALVLMLGAAAFYYYFLVQAQSESDTEVLQTIETLDERTIPLSDYELKTITIGDNTFDMYIADDPELRNQGLSYVKELPDNTGMLFQFETNDKHGFWMKGMQFPLDFIYVENNEVVELKDNISPDTYPNTISPDELANIIIEMNAGAIDTYGIQLGDSVSLED